ncbi:MAG: glycosyltransferase family 87 protein [Solirubrobacterales bacterium]|nr:glycosyltransferase family 87 protein [Solirubrobacterales bacterium]
MSSEPVLNSWAIDPPNAPESAAVAARVTAYLIVLGLLVAIAYSYRAGFYQGKSYPWNTFLFSPQDHFNDLRNLLGPVKSGNPLGYQWSVYPPFTYIMLEPFVWVGRSASVVLWLLIVAGGLVAFVSRQLDFIAWPDRVAVVVAITLLTYPFLFSFDRGNIDGVTTVLIAGFVWLTQTGRSKAAAVLIGAAAAMKGFPILFVAVPLVRRDWLACATAIGTAVGLTVLGSAYYSFDLPHALSLLGENLEGYQNAYVIGNGGLAFGSSLFGAIKATAQEGFGAGVGTVRGLGPVYTLLAVSMATVAVLALWRLRMALWEQVTLISVAYILLPTVSADYKLLVLSIPLALFLRYGTTSPWRFFCSAAFVLLMIPKPYVHLSQSDVNIGVFANPILLLALGTAMILTGWQRRSSARRPDGVAGQLETNGRVTR